MEIKKNKKKVIIFEMDDSQGKSERSSASRYIEPFMDFVASMGFTMGDKPTFYMESGDIEIEQTKLYFDFGNAVFMSQNKFTRDWAERKNRWVEIRTSMFSDEPGIRVRINKEMDGDDLKRRIQKLIDLNREHTEWRNNRDKTKALMIIAYQLWLRELPSYKKLRFCYVDKNEFTFDLEDHGRLVLHGGGAFKEFTFKKQSFGIERELREFSEKVEQAHMAVAHFIAEVQVKGWISVKGFKEWAENCHNEHIDLDHKKDEQG